MTGGGWRTEKEGLFGEQQQRHSLFLHNSSLPLHKLQTFDFRKNRGGNRANTTRLTAKRRKKIRKRKRTDVLLLQAPAQFGNYLYGGKGKALLKISDVLA